TPLSLAASAQQRGKRFGLPSEMWPVGLLPDPEGFTHDGCSSVSRLASLFGSCGEPIMPAIRLTVDSIQPLASLKGILASGVRSAALDVNAAQYLFFGTVYPDVLLGVALGAVGLPFCEPRSSLAGMPALYRSVPADPKADPNAAIVESKKPRNARL